MPSSPPIRSRLTFFQVLRTGSATRFEISIQRGMKTRRVWQEKIVLFGMCGDVIEIFRRLEYGSEARRTRTYL